MSCYRCSSDNLIKAGFNRNGNQREKCLICDRVQVANPIPAEDRHIKRQVRVIWGFGICLRCDKQEQDLANGLCVECWDSLHQATLGYYKRKLNEAMKEL